MQIYSRKRHSLPLFSHSASSLRQNDSEEPDSEDGGLRSTYISADMNSLESGKENLDERQVQQNYEERKGDINEITDVGDGMTEEAHCGRLIRPAQANTRNSAGIDYWGGDEL